MVGTVNEKITNLLKKGFLVGPDLIKELEDPNLDTLSDIPYEDRPSVITKDIHDYFLKKPNKINISWKDFEKARVNFEKGKDKKTYPSLLKLTNYKDNKEKLDKLLSEVKNPVKPIISLEKNPSTVPIVLRNYTDKKTKINVNTFVEHYKLRYNFLRKLLQARQDLSGAVSIDRLNHRRKGDKVSTIGMVYSKEYTKNKHLLLEIEDITGRVKCLVMNSKKDLFELSKDIVCDEVIGLKGTAGDGLIFIENVYFPDVPAGEIIKKGQKEEYIAFISDIQIGSKKFLKKSFMRFIDWINGEYGSKEQKEEALKIKYLCVVGDVVDGVGIYPGQESDLEIKDIYDQYNYPLCNDDFVMVCNPSSSVTGTSLPFFFAHLYHVMTSIYISKLI